MRRSRAGLVFVAALLLAAGGCADMDLGQIDETRDERDDMAGPGIFAEPNGETRLRWEVGGSQADAAAAPAASGLDEQAEFELFKEWQQMRAAGADSPEYREFLQWLEFRKFKAAQ